MKKINRLQINIKEILKKKDTFLFSINTLVSYSDINTKVKGLSFKLESLDVQYGDKIVIQSDNMLNLMVVFYTTQLLGLVFIPLDVNYSDVIVKEIMTRVNPKIAIAKTNISVHSSQQFVHEDELNLINRMGSLKSVAKSENELSVILFTSGTTGIPKGVMLSNENLFKSAKIIVDNYQWTKSDIILNLANIHTMSGIRNSLIAPLLSGSKVVNVSVEKSFFEIVEITNTLNVTILISSPIFIKQLNIFYQKIDSKKLSSLRYIMSTGSYLSKEELKRFKENYNIPLYNYYGLTETTGICIANTPRNSYLNKESLGTPFGCEVDVVDNNNRSLDVNQIGVLKVKGNTMLGYYENNTLTKKVLDKEGWFYTNDLVLKNSNNTICLLGRVDDAFNNEYTELVYPQEIENIILLDSIVDECCVFDYTSKFNIVKIRATLVLHQNLNNKLELLNRINKLIVQKLGKTKIISTIDIVDNLPKVGYGKLNRKQIKKEINANKIYG